jgi:SDR family mycofactocin-dependent oxidoreductase
MGRFDGKVVCITGAATGQGRCHAVRFAEEGADIVALDLGGLSGTAADVRATGRRVIESEVDVRDGPGMDAAISAAAAELGGLDVVIANAGIFTRGAAIDLPPQRWRDTIDINLTGAWHTCKPAVRIMRELGRGGSITIISSGAGLKGAPGAVHYAASKHAVVGLARVLAAEAGPDRIRVNTLHPTHVDTGMIQNEETWRKYRPDLDNPTREDAAAGLAAANALPVAWIDPDDVSRALLWLSSDEARFVTGVAFPVDAGGAG